MRLPRLAVAAPLFAAALLLSPPGAADDKTDDTAAFLSPDNWVGRSDIWKIENGAVVGETKEDPKYNTFFVSKKKYSDFELSFKVQLRGGVGNSGVQIRSTLRDDKKFVVAGPQVDVGKGYWGSLYGEGVGGMMKQAPADKIKEAVKPTEFNEFHIVAKGTHFTIKINGVTMVDQDFPTLPQPKPKDKDPKPADPKPTPTRGIIAFQAHGGYPAMRVEYKDIKFKVLK